MQVVSSFGPDGFELYGRSFLESYTKHWTVPMVCYVEEGAPDFRHPLIEYRNLFDVPGCVEFLQGCTFPIMRGMLGDKRVYQTDVYRFARKSFAQIDAAAGHNGLLFWLDADTEWSGPVPEAWLENAMQGTFMAYLRRPHWHLCSSFVGWDTSHPVSKGFWETYYNLYMSGQVFMLKEWHDAFVLQQLLEHLELPAKDIANLPQDMEGPVNVFNNVFWPTGNHKKGNLKIKEADAA